MADDGQRVVVITGANSGIGRATAEGLVARGDHVVLVCRTQAAAEGTAASLAHHPGSTSIALCDLSDPEAIAAAAHQIRQEHDRVDVLINNAGAYFPTRRENAEGLEMTFATNHLGPFRLTRHLLPIMANAGRIVVLSSRSHREGSLVLDDLQRTRRAYLGYPAYADSKLHNLLFVRELDRRLRERGSRVSVNAVHPGVIATGFAQDEPGLLHALYLVGRWLMPGPRWGARGSIRLATDPALEDVSGAYFSGPREARSTAAGRDMAAAAELWEATEALCSSLPPVP